DAAGGGAACGAGASRAGAGSERGDATAAGAAVLARADSKARSVTIGCGGVSCQTSHATQPTAKSIAIAMVRQKKSEASMRSDTGRLRPTRPPPPDLATRLRPAPRPTPTAPPLTPTYPTTSAVRHQILWRTAPPAT